MCWFGTKMLFTVNYLQRTNKMQEFDLMWMIHAANMWNDQEKVEVTESQKSYKDLLHISRFNVWRLRRWRLFSVVNMWCNKQTNISNKRFLNSVTAILLPLTIRSHKMREWEHLNSSSGGGGGTTEVKWRLLHRVWSTCCLTVGEGTWTHRSEEKRSGTHDRTSTSRHTSQNSVFFM